MMTYDDIDDMLIMLIMLTYYCQNSQIQRYPKHQSIISYDYSMIDIKSSYINIQRHIKLRDWTHIFDKEFQQGCDKMFFTTGFN